MRLSRMTRRVGAIALPALLTSCFALSSAQTAQAATYSGYSLNDLRSMCLAKGEQVSPYGGYYIPSTQVAEGSSNVCVALAQALMDAKVVDCVSSGLALDGIDGPLTTAAVECVQRRDRIAVDGIVGPYTWSALWFVD